MIATAGLAVLTARRQMVRHHVSAAVHRHRRRTLIQGAVLGPTALLLIAGVYSAAVAGFAAAASTDDARAAVSTVFAIAVLGGFIGSSSAALQSLYLANDLPFLLSLPITRRSLYAAKFLDAFAGTIPVAVIIAAFLTAYGATRADGWLIWIVGSIAALAILGATASLGVMIVAVIARFVPAKRARLFLLLVSLAVVGLAWTAWSAVAPDTTNAGLASSQSRTHLTLGAAADTLAWTPIGWAAQAVIEAGEGRAREAFAHGGLLLVSVACVGGAAFLVFTRTFARGYAGMRMAASVTPRPNRPAIARFAELGTALLPQPVAALVLKEWLTMFRDLRRLSGAVWPLGMVALYTVLLSRGDTQAPVGAPDLAFWLASGSLALVPWGASLGISIYAFGSEQRLIHLLRSLPVSPRRILLAKVWASLAPVLLLSETAAVVVTLANGASVGQMLGMMGLVAWATIGYVIVDTSAAAVSPNFGAAQIQRSTALTGRVFGFAAGTVFTLATALAASRLILFSTGVPDSLRVLTDWHVGDVAPFGWPLVIGATGLAALHLLFVLAIAEARLARIIRTE